MSRYFDLRYIAIGVGAVLVIGLGWWLFTGIFEFEKPEIKLAEEIERVGLQKSINVDFSDARSGLMNIAVWIEQTGNRFPIASVDLPKGTHEKTLHILVNSRELRLQDGEALLQISAVDHSLLKNKSTREIKIIVDSTPPLISALTSAHNINPGGTCLTLFRVSKEPARAGVMVGSDFFAAYPAVLGGKPTYMCYFPIPADVSGSTRISIFAQDKAGNQAASSLPFFIRKVKKFRSDTVTISDQFLQKMGEFQQYYPSLKDRTPVEVFKYVNTTLRDENTKKIQEICRKTQPKQLWSGLFLRMKNGAPMALFGDERTYLYSKQSIGNSVHLGVDLASTAHAPVEAANNGSVLFSGYLGIYGNAVIIDHGMGILTLYGHMESLDVKEGQQVATGSKIGVTGMSGLAGGDHLHFSVIVGERFVNPIEWWDQHWHQDNVDRKIKEVG